MHEGQSKKEENMYTEGEKSCLEGQALAARR